MNQKRIDKKVIAICLMSVSAMALMIADFVVPPAVHADQAVNSPDYQAVTARISGGGEGLYVLDNRLGILAVFTYDPSTRALLPRAVRPASDAFR